MAKYNVEDRRKLAAKGHALPDGSFPISDEEDLHSAVRNWNFGKQPEVAKRHIVKRARALGIYDKLPEKWRKNLEHREALSDAFLAHYGIKGMRWGVQHTPDSATGLINRGSAEKIQAKVDKQKAKDQATTAKRAVKAAPFHAKADEAKQQLADLDHLGLRSPLMKSVYGPKAADSSPLLFAIAYQTTKDRAIAKSKKELNEKLAWAEKNATAVEQGKLTTGQKKAIIGASVGIGLALATTGLAIYGGKKMAPIIAAQKLSDTRGITAEFGGGNISYDKFMKNTSTSIKASWGNAEHIARVGSTRLDDIDIQLPKGTQFTRVSTVAEKAVKSGNYAAFLPEDVTRYRAAFTNEKKYAEQLYNVKIDTLQNVRVPSLRKRVDTFVELLDDQTPKFNSLNPNVSAKDIISGVDGKVPLSTLSSKGTARDLLARAASSDKERDFIKKASSRELAEKYYSKVAGGNFGSDPLSKDFADRILKKGYHAIVDDMDAGVYGDKPMVLLDHTIFKVASSEPLTKEMIQQARETMTEVIGRKY